VDDSLRETFASWRARIDCDIVNRVQVSATGKVILGARPGESARHRATSAPPWQIRPSCASQRKYVALGYLGYLIIGIGHLLVAQAISPQAPEGSPRAPAAAPGAGPEKGALADLWSPWYIILDPPGDLDALWQRIKHPDLVLIKPDQLAARANGNGKAERADAQAPWLVESVQVRGNVEEDFARLTVELGVVVKGAAPVWAAIRLDGQRLMRAREGSLELGLRRVEPGQWQVKLENPGEHRVEIELEASITVGPGRKAFSLAIPEAASTGIDLQFSRGESEIAIGDDEVFGPNEPRDGRKAHVTAHLEPRSELEVSWTSAAEADSRRLPLLTAKGEIAVDIDEEQVRTRTSWAIRCVRGTARTLEMRLDDADDVTEFQVDEQPAEPRMERVRGTGKVTIRLVDPVRVGGVKRVVMKTRRPFANAGARRISLGGFPFVNAREQSGFIGITQSANLFIKPMASQGLRPVDTDKLPADLRARPSTSLAFEFLDQPFLLELAVDSSPPLFKADVKTAFRVNADRVRSETTIELERVRGQLSVLELGVAPGLRLISVGPPEIVAGSHLSDEIEGAVPHGASAPARRLELRLTTLGRDASKVTLSLAGLERISAVGRVNLGLFTPMNATSVSSSYALVGDQGLALEPDDDSGTTRRLSEPAAGSTGPKAVWPWTVLGEDHGLTPLLLGDDSHRSFLPIRIVRHARTIAQETGLSVQVSRRWLDVLGRTAFLVRHGSVSSLELRVPAAIADRWDLMDKELVDREELGQDADGTRRYLLSFLRPVVDRATVRYRYRVPLVPGLDAKTVREITIPEIAFNKVTPGPTKVELSLAPEIVLNEIDKGWVRAVDEARAEPPGTGAVISYEEGDSGRNRHPFAFKVLALEPVPLPTFVVPRLLLKTVSAGDDSLRTNALYWVESHGADFPFALPEGARWLGARVDGRLSVQVDFDPSRLSYRLRLPAEVGSRPALVELEYQLSEQATRSKWAAPRLLDGGVVLQSLWEVRLPLNKALLGVPSGWADENQWYWTGFMWKQRSWKNAIEINEWVLGSAASSRPLDDIDGSNLEDSDRYLFSRAGPPVGLHVWIVSRSWLVAICSGATLFVGFFVIFSRLRFQTTWLAISVIALLAAMLVQPSVMFLVLESGVIGAVLTLLGLMIELLIVRSRAKSVLVYRGATPATRAGTDSALKRPPEVGSDDSTAIRVRVPSTVDFIATPAAASAPPAGDQPRGSRWENM
jgi:hypothetical protein